MQRRRNRNLRRRYLPLRIPRHLLHPNLRRNNHLQSHNNLSTFLVHPLRSMKLKRINRLKLISHLHRQEKEWCLLLQALQAESHQNKIISQQERSIRNHLHQFVEGHPNLQLKKKHQEQRDKRIHLLPLRCNREQLSKARSNLWGARCLLQVTQE